MSVFNLYIFDRNGACIFYREWRREREAGSLSRQESVRCVEGGFCRSQSLRSYETSKYRLHFLGTPTGLKFVLNTQPDATFGLDLLQTIYSQIYVPNVVKSPVYKPGTQVTSDLFTSALDALVQKHVS